MNLGEINAEQGLNSFFQGIVPKDKTLSILRKKLNSIEVKKQFVLIIITHMMKFLVNPIKIIKTSQ